MRQAIRGAFSQNYQPLEVILSDDCSADKSFDVMKAMAASYKGPHRIILNRNDENLGIGGHVNRLMELSTGRFFVIAAGDDISKPERVSLLEDAWERSEGRAKYLYSAFEVIDKKGNPCKQSTHVEPPHFKTFLDGIRDEFSGAHGCSGAWQRDLFDTFGPLRDGLVSEDRALSLRASVLGEVQYIPDKLVMYRQHGDNVYNRAGHSYDNGDWLRRKIELWKIHQSTYEQFLADLSHPVCRQFLGPDHFKRACHIASASRKRFYLKSQFAAASGFHRFGIFMACLRKPVLIKLAGKFLLRILLPWVDRRLSIGAFNGKRPA